MEISIEGWRSCVKSAAKAAGVEIFFCEGAGTLTGYRLRREIPPSETGGVHLLSTEDYERSHPHIVDRLVFDGREWTLFLGSLDKNGGRSGESTESLAEAKELLAKLLGNWPKASPTS